MIVTIKIRYFLVSFILIFASIDLWVIYSDTPFYAIAMSVFTAGYIIHEPAHAIVAHLCNSENISMMLGGYRENWVEFKESDPIKITAICGIGALIQMFQCAGIVLAAIISEWNKVSFIPTIIAILIMGFFFMDSKIPHSDIARTISWINNYQED